MSPLSVPKAPESRSSPLPSTSGSGASPKRHTLPRHFFKQFFLDVDGSPSCSRFLSAIVVGVSTLLACAHVALQHKLPDGAFFLGIGSMLTALYGMNQVRNMLNPK